MPKDMFNQLCVWPGCVVGDEPKKIEDFVNLMKKEFKVRVKYAEEIKTLPDPDERYVPEPKSGGRNDLFFFVHDEDIQLFALPRLKVGIRWWEDVLGNGGGVIYDDEVLERYPKTW